MGSEAREGKYNILSTRKKILLTLFLLGDKFLPDAKHCAEEDAVGLQPTDVGLPRNRGTSKRPEIQM